jgi:hypothetical protein
VLCADAIVELSRHRPKSDKSQQDIRDGFREGMQILQTGG